MRPGAAAAPSLLGVFLLGLLISGPAAADEPGAARRPDEEPALGRAPPAPDQSSGFWARRPRGPRLELFWRTFDVAEMASRTGRYHLFGLQHYFISGLLRAGALLEGGIDDTPRGNFLFDTGLSLGVQWPSRLTPWLDLVAAFGMLRFDYLHDNLICFTWQVGLDLGLHFFVHRRFFISGALGWRRFSYRQPGSDHVAPLYLYNDTLSLRLGLGF